VHLTQALLAQRRLARHRISALWVEHMRAPVALLGKQRLRLALVLVALARSTAFAALQLLAFERGGVQRAESSATASRTTCSPCRASLPLSPSAARAAPLAPPSHCHSHCARDRIAVRHQYLKPSLRLVCPCHRVAAHLGIGILPVTLAAAAEAPQLLRASSLLSSTGIDVALHRTIIIVYRAWWVGLEAWSFLACL
jgi:hypothetical protein